MDESGEHRQQLVLRFGDHGDGRVDVLPILHDWKRYSSEDEPGTGCIQDADVFRVLICSGIFGDCVHHAFRDGDHNRVGGRLD